MRDRFRRHRRVTRQVLERFLLNNISEMKIPLRQCHSEHHRLSIDLLKKEEKLSISSRMISIGTNGRFVW